MNFMSTEVDPLNPQQLGRFDLREGKEGNELSEADGEILFEIECEEKGRGGEVVKVNRKIRQLIFTPTNLEKFYNLCSKHQSLFWTNEPITFKHFLDTIFNQDHSGRLIPKGLYYVIDDFVGVVYLNPITPEIDAQAHFAFFDRKLDGREELCKKLMEMAFREFNFHRLTIELPLYASRKLFPFVESLGFKSEGRRRQLVYKFDKWYDVKLYYLLQENFLNRKE